MFDNRFHQTNKAMMMAISLSTALVAALILAMWPQTGHADTYHVSVKGRDSNDGSSTAPWRTLQKAAEQVRAGDTVIVAPGHYTGFELKSSGTAKARIRFVGKPGAVIDHPFFRKRDTVNLEGASHIDIEGFTVTGAVRAGIRAVECKHVHIRNNRVIDNDLWAIFTGFCDDLVIENNVAAKSRIQHGIYVSNASERPVVRGNHIYGNTKAGIHMNGDASMGRGGIIKNARIEANLIHDNGTKGAAGINCDGVVDSVIRNNILYDNHANGITLYRIDGGKPSSGNRVVHNTIVMPTKTRWCMHIHDGSTDNVFMNNICLNAHGQKGSLDVTEDSLRGLRSDHNLVVDRFTTTDGESRMDLAGWRKRSGQDRNSRIARAKDLFVDAKNGDFRLKPGSAAIDAGQQISARQAGAAAATASGDYMGNRRSMGKAPDIGAIEYCQGSACKEAGSFAGPNLLRARKAAESKWPAPNVDADADVDVDG